MSPAEDHVVARLAAERQPVYDLEVEEAHCFFANGLLAHNCDPARYLCRQHPTWSAAYACGEPTHSVLSPLSTPVQAIPVPHQPMSPAAQRDEMQQRFTLRSRRSVIKQFSRGSIFHRKVVGA